MTSKYVEVLFNESKYRDTVPDEDLLWFAYVGPNRRLNEVSSFPVEKKRNGFSFESVME